MNKYGMLIVCFLVMGTTTAYASGTIEDGLYRFYVGQKGPLMSLSYYRDLKQDGCLFEYYDNGDIQQQSWFKAGKLNGATKFFYKNGQLKKLVMFDEGRVVSVKLYDQQGSLIVEKTF